LSGISDTRRVLNAKMKGHSRFSIQPCGRKNTSITPLSCASGLRNRLLNCGNSGLPKVCHILRNHQPPVIAMPASTPTPNTNATRKRCHQASGAVSKAAHSATA
jgi:hypothetical protein